MAEVADAAEQGSARDEEVTSNELASYELPSTATFYKIISEIPDTAEQGSTTD